VTDIFISYSSKDRTRVRPIVERFEALKYKVFWDIKIPIGETFDSWIRKNLKLARVVIVIWTKHSIQSDAVKHEAALARRDNKLIPAMMDKLDVLEDIPLGFYSAQIAFLHDWTPRKKAHVGYSNLVAAVKQRFVIAPAAVVQVAQKEDADDVVKLQALANQGHHAAQLELGYRYDTGTGVARNQKKALKLYQLSAAQGNAIAHYNLGIMHEFGEAGLQPDDEQAVAHYRQAADKGDSDGQFNLSVMYDQGRGGLAKNKFKAAEYLKLSAAQGNPDAIVNLALMHQKGEGGLKESQAEAVKLYKKASARGDAYAKVNLGLMYEEGLGVAQSDKNAVKFYRAAAEKGDSTGQAYLACMYEDGRGGLPLDLKEARRLYRLAAKHGEPFAVDALARLG
jgi:TPR repeat protein